jgi:oligopeptide/dipeptide ABC transporter ATP-binding protein
MPLISVQDLQLEFQQSDRSVRVLDGVSLQLEAGATLALVGESGSGKSLTALALTRLLPSPPARITGGTITVAGQEVLRLSAAGLQKLRGGVVSYVFQEPGAALNPVQRVGDQIREMLRLHRPEADTAAEVVRLLTAVGIPSPETRAVSYPHELSGGMQQRVMLAMALASRPQLLVADEPTTALDVTIQAQVMELLKSLRQELGMAVLLITHNLGLVGDFADRLAVMYAGQIVEEGPTQEVLRRPRHPYTQALLAAVPRLGTPGQRLAAIPGTVPSPGEWPSGCRFHPRCPIRRPECGERMPEMEGREAGHAVRCPFGECG